MFASGRVTVNRGSLTSPSAPVVLQLLPREARVGQEKLAIQEGGENQDKGGEGHAEGDGGGQKGQEEKVQEDDNGGQEDQPQDGGAQEEQGQDNRAEGLLEIDEEAEEGAVTTKSGRQVMKSRIILKVEDLQRDIAHPDDLIHARRQLKKT